MKFYKWTEHSDPVPDMQPVCKMQEEGSYPLHCPQATLTWRAILPSLTFSTAISTLTSHLCLVQLNNSCTSFGWPRSSLTTPVLTQFNAFKIFISDTQTKKQVYMPRSYHKLKNNMNGQDSMSPIKFTSPVDILSIENCIHEHQDTKLKRTISKKKLSQKI